MAGREQEEETGQGGDGGEIPVRLKLPWVLINWFPVVTPTPA